jgi:hypothetical protein
VRGMGRWGRLLPPLIAAAAGGWRLLTAAIIRAVALIPDGRPGKRRRQARQAPAKRARAQGERSRIQRQRNGAGQAGPLGRLGFNGSAMALGRPETEVVCVWVWL